MTTKDQERQAIEKIRKIVEGLGENSYVGFAMDGILELAEDNIREDTAYSMKERAEIAQKDARKAEKENKDLKAEIEDLKKTVEKRGATISELNTELCNARAEAKANEIPEELIQEMYCMAYDKEAESIGKMEKGSRSDDRSHYRRRRCTWIRRGVQEAEREPEQIQKSDGDAGPERKTEGRKMKKIDFRQRAAKTEERKRKSKYADVMVRATVMGLMKPDEDVDRMMDIESADKKFNMRLDEWLNADDFNFAHDFYGIVNNINREKGFPATDFGFFVPRFAGR